jgi:hypothetical protein
MKATTRAKARIIEEEYAALKGSLFHGCAGFAEFFSKLFR